MRTSVRLAGSVAAVVLFPVVAAAQVPVYKEVGGIEIEGPPPPTGRDVVNWDDAGRATVRATRAT